MAADCEAAEALFLKYQSVLRQGGLRSAEAIQARFAPIRTLKVALETDFASASELAAEQVCTQLVDHFGSHAPRVLHHCFSLRTEGPPSQMQREVVQALVQMSIDAGGAAGAGAAGAGGRAEQLRRAERAKAETRFDYSPLLSKEAVQKVASGGGGGSGSRGGGSGRGKLKGGMKGAAAAAGFGSGTSASAGSNSTSNNPFGTSSGAGPSSSSKGKGSNAPSKVQGMDAFLGGGS